MSTTERLQFESESGQVIVKELGSGAHATVYATIDKAHADRFLVQYRAAGRNPVQQKAVFEAVRTYLSAAKVGRVDWRSLNENTKAEDFRKEIENLQYINQSHQASGGQSIMQRITRTNVGPASKTWYMMEILSKGTIVDMRSTFYRRYALLGTTIPAGLLWHIIISLCETLQFLHFGIINGQVSGAPRLIAHSDLHGDNILFRYPGKYGNFPDVVVIDFGMAKSSPPRPADNAFWTSQVKDLEKILDTLMTLISKADGDLINLNLAYETLGQVSVSDSNQDLKDTLTSVVAFAKRQRIKRYHDLPLSWVEYFSRPAVSDEELDAFFQDLEVKRMVCSRETL